MKKLLLFLLLCNLTTLGYSETRAYPEQGIIPYLGLDDTSDPLMAKDNRASAIQNITLNLDGTAQKRYGYSRKNGTLDTNDISDTFEAVTGLYELRRSNGTNNLIATCANKIFYDNSGTWTNITGGNTTLITEGQDYQWSWITALDYAIGTNGTDPPICWNGSGVATPLTISGLTNSLTKAKCITWWKNYLIFGNTTEAGINHTTRIRWSNVGTINTYTDVDFIDIATLGGQQIEGFGILYDNLFVFLTSSIYKVSLVGGDELFNVSKVSEGIGCIAKNSIQNILINNIENLIFLSKDATINQFNGVGITESSILIRGTLDNLKISRLPYAVSAVNQQTSHYYLSVTNTNAATSNNLLLDFYYEVGEWSKHTGIEANAMAVANDSNSLPQVYFGNYKSFVYQLDDSNKQDDVYGFTGFFEDKSTYDTATASGLDILYDTAFSFYDVLLLHCDGTDGSNIFTDEAGKTFTAYGNAQIDTAEKKFGSGSGLFDGAGDYLSASDHTDWNLGASSWSIDFWVYITDLSASSYIFRQQTDASNYFQCFIHSTGYISMGVWEGVWTFLAESTAEDIVANTWYHIAIINNGTNVKIYKNGTVTTGTATISTGVPNLTGNFFIGSDATSGNLKGYIDEFRVGKGVARWTANFTSPISAYGNSGLVSVPIGSTLRIISGSGEDEERVVCDSTTSGIVVTNSTTAVSGQVSEYDLGRINAFYTTKWNSLGSIKRKNFQDLYLWTTKKSTATLNLYYAGDEVSTIQNINLNDYDNDSLWGTNIVSGETVTWSGEELSLSKLPLNISGRFIKTKFEEDDIGESMKLHSYNYFYEELDYR